MYVRMIWFMLTHLILVAMLITLILGEMKKRISLLIH